MNITSVLDHFALMSKPFYSVISVNKADGVGYQPHQS